MFNIEELMLATISLFHVLLMLIGNEFSIVSSSDYDEDNDDVSSSSRFLSLFLLHFLMQMIHCYFLRTPLRALSTFKNSELFFTM